MNYDITPQVNNRKGSVPPSFLSEKQTAAYLNMSVSWLRKCRDKGTGPVWMKFGNSIRYPNDALVSYVQQSTRNFTGEYRLPPALANKRGQTSG
ncbi:helix-turn-helix domain-containing protein [Phaeobacter gallaeciensis]|uniref:helix-turn-helix domain-containing protein n=1 Tax=Phaeobacter gallaeciensis TaxID=60890 RepID=UPI00237F7790|nr:helix-turn-helix domain-containing protein [Phaeobacter gallaeciensis]MDE4140958.1 helix-turn-helix domain-containing protein [Phaeobacter gallaeciensis]MDE4149403.1 helix-turn-helix domain-containing protein [Phaeobacter gallaeciensis]MDE4153404.1 helix-turn-helix domain-containing protein [Phaeobacter gallaeciensis]MDE4228793.1 helix-turn-helix domain-containing protein [Phaeobacter gallaeciensis]MDE4257868.1 helix-turn-helix domain-containing protein [Phaeobacter gallaeciensis]